MIDLVQLSTDETVNELAGLARNIWNEYFPAIIGQAQVDYMVDKFQSVDAIKDQIESGYQYFFISEDGTNVGYTGLLPRIDISSLQISKLYLLKDWRGRGIARQVLKSVSEMAVKDGYNKLYLTVNKYNLLAINTYEKYGFTKVGDIIMDIGSGFVMDDFEMQKIINT
jgi:ribosomal protein S18 acetylase RimI-like enzyme